MFRDSIRGGHRTVKSLPIRIVGVGQVFNAAVNQHLWIWFSACSEGSVAPPILMDQYHGLPDGVDVCYHL